MLPVIYIPKKDMNNVLSLVTSHMHPSTYYISSFYQLPILNYSVEVCHGNYAYPVLAPCTGYSASLDEEYSKVYPNKPLPPKSFLEWLIALCEGDGSVSLSSNNRSSFTLTPNTVPLPSYSTFITP